MIAEESLHPSEVPPNCVVFDPLDGTALYSNGGTEYGVTLCALREGEPEAGVIYFPHADELISAVRGEGCFRWGFGRGERIRINRRLPLDKTLLGTDVGPWNPPDIHQALRARFCIRSLMVAVAGAREVLAGVTGAYWNLNVAKIWDAAAGALAVQEAGGVACAPDGSPLRWDRVPMDYILAVNQTIADAVVGVTRAWPGREVSPE